MRAQTIRGTCRAAGLVEMTSPASFKEWEARISPSAAITLALASLAASASVAMARWSCTGSRTSFLKQRHPLDIRSGQTGQIGTGIADEFMAEHASGLVSETVRRTGSSCVRIRIVAR